MNKDNSRDFFICTDNRILELILLPTEQCNFRCLYCYENFNIGKMTQNVQNGIVRLIEQRIHTLSVLNINWFGGEPLLATDVIMSISERAQSLCAHHSVAYHGSMTTNGALLNKSCIEKLYRLGIMNYQISLDGWEDVHDRTRVRLNGGGTFKQIWRNLLAINDMELSVDIALRLHVTNQNYASLGILMDRIIELLNPHKFKIFIKAIENLGGDKIKKSDCLFDDINIKRSIVYELKEKSDYYNNKRIISSSKIKEVGNYICYASKANSFVIRATGEVGKCTVALCDPRNSVGRILSDGRIKLDSEKMALWLRGLKDMNYDALGCPLHSLPLLKELTGSVESSPTKTTAHQVV